MLGSATSVYGLLLGCKQVVFGELDDCARISGLVRWHTLMPGLDGYARASSHMLSRASRTRTLTGFTGAGPTVSPSSTVLCNRQ